MSAFSDAQKQVAQAAQFVTISKQTLKKLQNPDRVIKKTLTITMDTGKKKSYPAYRSQHNNLLGPYKGGIRYHTNVSEDEVKALSLWMTFKTGVAGISYGGGKGGITVDPKQLSQKELERLSRAYGKAFAPYIGPWLDVPAPDMNTNGQIMAWMLDEYEKYLSKKGLITLQNYRATLTGKPIILGGSQGREEATGLGGFYVLQQLVKKLGKKAKETTIAVQGFGNVAYNFALFAAKAGFKVVAISNSQEGIHVAKGIDPEKILKTLTQHNNNLSACVKLKTIPGAKIISNEELLQLDVDILVPAAIDGVLYEGNIKNVKAPIVIELANGPMTVAAEEMFLKNSKHVVVPDILANAGGVVVSYFEWVQNLQGYYWQKEEVYQKLETLMDTAFNRVWQEYQEKNITMRQAAYIVALKRLIEAENLLHSEVAK